MIYLDNASTTFPKPPAVIEAASRYLTEVGASPGRGGYRTSSEAQRLVDDVRRRLTELVNGTSVARMIFTASCTDALNMAIHGILDEGDHVVTTMLEHNSVNRPLQGLRDAGRITLSRVPFSADGLVDPEDIARALTHKTRLIVLNHASNVTGIIQPAADIGAVARQRNVIFLLDAAQTIGLLDIDVEALGVDLLTVPAHKELLAPPGLGALYVGEGVKIRPWREGGTGVDSANPRQPSDWPAILEAGTPNSVAIAGLGAALREIKPAETLAHLRALIDRLLAGMSDEKRFAVVGKTGPACRVGTVSVRIAEMSPEDAGAILDESFGICVRCGLHCAPYAHRLLGTFPDGTIRISPGRYTTEEDIDRTCEAFRQIIA